MPTIHAAGYTVPTAPSVQPSDTSGGAYQNIQAPLGAFGGYTAQALTRFSEQAEKAAGHFENIQNLHDTISSNEQVNNYEDSLNKIMYGDPANPGDTGYLGLQGKDAVEQRAVVRKQIDDLTQRYRGNAQTVQQQLMFDRQARGHRNTALNQVGSHFDAEYKAYGAATLEAGAKNGIDRAGTAAAQNDFNKWQAELADTTTKVAQSLKLRGASDESIQAAVGSVTKSMSKNWVMTRMEQDPLEARNFLEQNKELFGADYDDLVNRTHEAARRQQIQEIAGTKPVPPGRPNYTVGSPTNMGFRAPPGRLIEGATPQEQTILNEIRHRESSGDYKKIGPTQDHGAFQFQDTTWREAAAATGLGREYAHASDAPDRIQDANALWLLRNRGTTPWASSGPYPGYGPVEQRQGGAIRNLPIATTVNAQLERAATAVGDLKVEVFSGGQPSSGPNRTGSHRHDEGGAADIQLRDVKTGQLLDMRKPEDRARMQKFITEAVAAGATGVGAAENYMGPHGIHIGGGPPAAWGAGGSSANAPDWVRNAHGEGRARSGGPVAPAPAQTRRIAPTLTPPQGGSGGGTAVQAPASAGGEPPVNIEPLAGAAVEPTAGAPAPAAPAPPPDVLLKTPRGTPLPLVPYGEGESLDSEVPGMLEALEAAAKRMPEDPRGDIWPGVVKELRQKYNNAYQATMHAERLRAVAQQKIDRELGETYIQRMFDPTRAPTEQEIFLNDKLSSEKRKDLISIMRSLNKPEPRPDVNAANEIEIVRRMGLPDDDPQKISNERQLQQWLIDKQINADTWRSLRRDFEQQNNTRDVNINKEQTRLIDRAGPLLNPTKRAAGAGMAAYTDPTGGHAQREAAYADYVIQSIRAARDDPKALRALLDPNPENKQYLGRQELLQQYGEYGAIGRPIMEKAAEIASQKPLAPIDRTKIKGNQDIQKLLQDGKLGPAGSPEAVQAARQLSIDMGFSRPPVTVAPPVR